MIIACILIVLLLTGLLLTWSLKRGQKTVRAYVFLSTIAEGQSVAYANELASRIDLRAAGELQARTMALVDLTFGGSQLKLISYARIEGFNQ